MTSLPQTATRLGWAGLLPFVAAPLGIFSAGARADLVGAAVSAYALAILSFLAGSWWGIALIRRRQDVLIASNLVVIIACLGFVLVELHGALLLLAGMFVALAGVERWHPMLARQPAYYAALRLRLSVVASVSLLLSAALL